MIGFGEATPLGSVARAIDFFSASECRDLLFHVQEHQLSLPEIKAFLVEHNLRLIGFDVEPRVARQYRTRFPEDRAMIDLDLWNIFETENPLTFAAMYQFFIQKQN